MRFFYHAFFLLVSCICVQPVLSQGFFTGINGTTINVPCGSSCNTLQVKLPHLKTSSEYIPVSIAYTPTAYITAGGNELTSLYRDDWYSPLISLPFPVCFYDSTYNSVAVGSNGMISFNATLANNFNGFTVNNPIPSVSYPQASVFGVHTDLNPNAASSPNDKKIEWRLEGVAPFRKLVVSYYHIGMFMTGNNYACSRDIHGNAVSPTTFQIVLYEQTGLIDVFIENKTCHTASSGGRALLGIQNWQRNKGVAVPGRNATVWPAVANEGWRFVPSGATSRFVKAEIYDLAGVLLQTTTPADTTTTTQGLLDVNFNNICFTGSSKQFVVKGYFSSCPSGNPLVSNDTITVVKGNLTATVSSTAAGCAPNGTATITMPAGSSPYTFAIGTNAPVNSTNNSYTFTGLIAGTYTLTGTNSSGCSASSTVTVALNGSLNIQATPIAPTCSGVNNGSIVVNPQNGTPPFQYNINNGAYQTSNTFSNLAPGTFVIGARDSSGCVVANHVVNIGAASPVAATITPANVSCNGGNNGSVSIGFNSTALPLQYSLDGINYQSSNTFTGLSAGGYTAYFRDANNCGGTQNFVITQPTALSLTVNKTDALCNGGNGTITLTAGGGTTGYQYSINGTTYQTANSFNVVAGTYTVYVRDAANCIVSSSITINQPIALTATTVSDNASCNGGADGRIIINAVGGTPGYQYSTNGTTFQASNIFNVTQGTYTVTIKDANGCITTSTASVGLINNLTVSLSADTTICEGTTATLKVTTNATQVLWSSAGTLSDATSFSPVANPKDTTEYVLTATLGACTKKDSLIVRVNPAPVADAGINDEVCFGQGYTLQGSGGVFYEWSPTTYFNSGNSSSTQNPAITPSQTVTYSLMVTDARGCKSLSPASVTIIITPPIKVNAFPIDTVVARGDVIQLRASSPVNDYAWSPGFGLDNAAKQNPIATIDADIIYVVTAYTGAGCKGTDTVKIKVYNGPEIYVPTAFTPNGDGRNELLMPFPVGIKELKFFRVYNRWGQLVFETKTLSHGWDGKLGGINQPMATYVWVLEAVTKENQVIKRRGTTTLIR